MNSVKKVLIIADLLYMFMKKLLKEKKHKCNIGDIYMEKIYFSLECIKIWAKNPALFKKSISLFSNFVTYSYSNIFANCGLYFVSKLFI